MKNEVNRAFMAKKKQYYIPQTEVFILSAEVMQTAHAFGVASQPAQMGTGSGNLAPKRRAEVF